MLRWIQQRDENLLENDDLDSFITACIPGTAFLASNLEFYQRCGLSLGISLALELLVDEVKNGDFIPWS